MNVQRLQALVAVLVLAVLITVPAAPARAATNVAFTSFEGAWVSGQVYSAGEVVTYQGALYISLVGSNSHHPPALAPRYWSVMAPGNTTFGSNKFQYNGSDSTASQCTVGSILLFAGFQWPEGNYVPADGSLLPISSYEALFDLLGTNYGGDGVSNFAVPDLRSAAPNNLIYLICWNGVFP
jgi:hypothetical protein